MLFTVACSTNSLSNDSDIITPAETASPTPLNTPDGTYEAFSPFSPKPTSILNTDPANTPENTPTSAPTVEPTSAPTKVPTKAPTKAPTATPTIVPTTPTPTPKATKAPTPNLTSTPKAHVEITEEILNEIEAGFLMLVNEERASLGLNPLFINLYLDDYALMRSQEIVTLFSHTRPDGSDCFSGINTSSYNYSSLGENIAYNHHFKTNVITEETRYFTGSQEQITTVYTNIFNAFKNSPGHYANMISESFKECGIGISVKFDTSINVPYFYLAHIFGSQQ